MGRANEARRGEAGAAQGRSRIRLDHPSCFPPSAQSLLSVRPSPPSASLSWSACPVNQRSRARERLSD